MVLALEDGSNRVVVANGSSSRLERSRLDRVDFNGSNRLLRNNGNSRLLKIRYNPLVGRPKSLVFALAYQK